MAKMSRAFSVQYDGLVDRLPSETVIEGPGGNTFKARAVWDTGAMKTVITPGAAAALSLSPVDSITVNGITNVSQASIVIISVILPNRIRIDNIYAAVCDMRQGIDLLIGMDIIKKGDLVIANGSEKTLFSFAVPPLQNKINLAAISQSE